MIADLESRQSVGVLVIASSCTMVAAAPWGDFCHSSANEWRVRIAFRQVRARLFCMFLYWSNECYILFQSTEQPVQAADI